MDRRGRTGGLLDLALPRHSGEGHVMAHEPEARDGCETARCCAAAGERLSTQMTSWPPAPEAGRFEVTEPRNPPPGDENAFAAVITAVSRPCSSCSVEGSGLGLRRCSRSHVLQDSRRFRIMPQSKPVHPCWRRHLALDTETRCGPGPYVPELDKLGFFNLFAILSWGFDLSERCIQFQAVNAEC